MVDVQGPPPVVDMVFPYLALRAGSNAGVVANDVDCAVLSECRVAQSLHRFEGRDVGDDADDVSSSLAQFRRSGFHQLRDHIGDHHLHSLGAEPLGQRPTDPLASAGDHRHLSDHVPHDAPLLARRPGGRPPGGEPLHLAGDCASVTAYYEPRGVPIAGAYR
jgi:hypothetical protein